MKLITLSRLFVIFPFFFLWFVPFSPSYAGLDSIPNTRFVEGIGSVMQFSRPFWADMHSSMTRAEVAWALNSSEYDYGGVGELYKPYVFSNLGHDLPIWHGKFQKGKYEFGVTLPFFIDVWMDFFERSTAPVINTAYRFGAPEFVFLHNLERNFLKIRNYSLRFTPMKHECTHLGDELTIRRKVQGYPLTRINVSYNYTELGITLNDPNGTSNSNHAFRWSVMCLLSPKSGWYNIIPEEGNVNLVRPTKIPWESYAQYQYQSRVFQSSHLQLIASAELRLRVKYAYPYYWSGSDENWLDYPIEEWQTTSMNVMVGVRYTNPIVMKNYKIGLGLRAYNGINPYGQFRSMPYFNQLGVCLLFEQ